MKRHRVRVRYVFEGFFDVMAEDKAEAGAVIERDCGLVMGTGIQAYNDRVRDWDFCMHPQKQTVSVKQIK